VFVGDMSSASELRSRHSTVSQIDRNSNVVALEAAAAALAAAPVDPEPEFDSSNFAHAEKMSETLRKELEKGTLNAVEANKRMATEAGHMIRSLNAQMAELSALLPEPLPIPQVLTPADFRFGSVALGMRSCVWLVSRVRPSHLLRKEFPLCLHYLRRIKCQDHNNALLCSTR
jgi:hypothetical protein